ncbi:hypothetical protein MLP_28560 [Microlunatus phosphovorus NM-1]|uniref:DUF3800 domain-containing protein n=1 Tax=Microlunatus phosphovorus (strain ATCC 700054 / DSM 10555 / JCM 9379 / NBRC 101784 / NCIMB 13414 / VKM Ac-1990 / NM-1) TaxID=1032480 RepID=F5XJH0_MICPN|nr:hypothetical protein [Microlunatus phosphovorus]BAK35870.1 hypothetical protein MLP_28560 [Microlunatus phosphovorus NM-1]
MSTHIYVDETKAKGYLVAAAIGSYDQLRIAKRELDGLLLPGQRSLHMKDEKESRKRAIADTIVRFQSLELRVALYDAGRIGTERDRRVRCFRALLDDVPRDVQTRVLFDRDETLLSWDRQTLLDLTSTGDLRDRISYAHVTRHQEPLLILPDAIAWCWAKGGHWRQRVRPIVSAVREI